MQVIHQIPLRRLRSSRTDWTFVKALIFTLVLLGFSSNLLHKSLKVQFVESDPERGKVRTGVKLCQEATVSFKLWSMYEKCDNTVFKLHEA